MTEPTTFQRLQIDGWRQFDKIDIALHARLTVLTGANGAGKSTLLNIFSRHFGWDRPYLATPTFEEGVIRYLAGLLRRLTGSQPKPAGGETKIGSLSYANGKVGSLNVPANVGHSYSLDIPGQQEVPGLHVPSHRVLSRVQQVAQIPTTVIQSRDALNNYVNEQQARYRGDHSSWSPAYRLKEALIAMAMFGQGNTYVRSNPEVLKTYLGFIEVLRKVLPSEFGFQTIEIRVPEIVLVTESGNWPLDAASGGIMAIIDIAWQIYLFSQDKPNFVVTIDEPENHLHPSMQRSLMTNLITAFPKAQFIVATHSPFIVSSVQNSHVFVLKFDPVCDSVQKDAGEPDSSYARRVSSLHLDSANKAGTASEILREVLGVKATVPVWVEERLAQVVEAYRNKPFDSETLAQLRTELGELGFAHLYPEALDSLLAKK